MSLVPYSSDDLSRMIDLVLAYPDHNFHVVDLPYRLASWALVDPHNVALWEDGQGALAGWAVAQRPFAALDYALKPGVPDLEDQILAWAAQRWQQIANESGSEVYFFTGVRADQPDRIARLGRHGFARDDWSLSHMVRALDRPIPPAAIPEGFTIRPLAGVSEAAAYTALHRAAFGSENMTADWRARTIEQAGYTPDLDLVMTAPGGSLAAFCICWIGSVQGQIVGQVEPLGVHPDYQNLGLGRILLAEGLRRMQAHGATTALIEAYSTNAVSQHLYHAVGFRTVYEAAAYFRVLKPADS